jgi:Tol biopolymer transport system component
VFTGWEKGGEPGRSFAWIQDLDPVTGAAGALTKLPLPAGVPGAEWASWSPRGDEIGLEVAVGPARHAVWVVNADGSGGQKRVEYDMKTYGGLDWTPDGKSLVYAALVEGRMQIFAVGARDGEPRQLTRDAAHLFQPQVSPDGRHVACTRLSQRKEIW